MTDTTERTYTLAEVREACIRGAQRHGASEGWAAQVASELYPDPLPPEPERRWVPMWDDREVARDADGTWYVRWFNRVGLQRGATDDHIRALASLLPRVSVTVTEEHTDRALKALWGDGAYVGYVVRKEDEHSTEAVRRTMRAALSAVAADLAQPVHACQHRATRWAVVDTQGGDAGLMHDTKQRAEDVRVDYDRRYADVRPHRVVGLAEVE